MAGCVGVLSPACSDQQCPNLRGMTEPEEQSQLNLRPAARAIVLGPNTEILLVRFELHTGTFWATPGGGLEPGESHADAIRRELDEEVGIVPDELVGPVWLRTHYFPLYGFDGQTEEYFLVQVNDLSVQPSMTDAELVAEGVTAHRWWTEPEIAASEERFAPLDLAEHLRNLILDGVPQDPVQLGT